MKKEELIKIIREEIQNELANNNLQINEIYDLDQVNYSSTIRKHVDNLVDSIEKTTLSKIAIASILNDIIMGLGLNRTQMTMYMGMIKQHRQKYGF
jgi:hypothetical protein